MPMVHVNMPGLKNISITSLALILASVQQSLAQVNYSQYVNAFIGGSGPTPGEACKSSRMTANRFIKC